MDLPKFIEELENGYGVKLSAEIKDFYEKELFSGHTKIDLIEGYARGAYMVDFTNESLTNLESLAEVEGIDEPPTQEEWKETKPGLMPFATLLYPPEDTEDTPPKKFLVIDTVTAGHPVFLWNYDGPYFYPLASSLSDLLAGKAPKEDAEFKDFDGLSNMSYESFKWV